MASKRGFGAMSREAVKAIAKKGGKAAHAANTAHKWSSNEARIAGAKGGKSTHAKRRAAKALAPVGTKAGDVAQGAKDPHRMVEVACSSAAGCSGVAHADEADGDMVGEIPTKKSKSHKNAAQGPSANEDPDNMAGEGASCHSGCGSK